MSYSTESPVHSANAPISCVVDQDLEAELADRVGQAAAAPVSGGAVAGLVAMRVSRSGHGLSVFSGQVAEDVSHSLAVGQELAAEPLDHLVVDLLDIAASAALPPPWAVRVQETEEALRRGAAAC